MNPRHVRVLLFAPTRDDVAQTVGTEALRRLAFLAGGTGGRGTGAPTMWAPTWYGGGARRTLAWTAQTCCGAVDFMAPWRVVRWQPDSLSFLPLSDGAVGDGEEAKGLGPALGGARSDVLTIVRSVFFSLFCRSLRSPPHAP